MIKFGYNFDLGIAPERNALAVTGAAIGFTKLYSLFVQAYLKFFPAQVHNIAKRREPENTAEGADWFSKGCEGCPFFSIYGGTMLNSNATAKVLSVSITLAVLGACSSGSPQMTPPSLASGGTTVPGLVHGGQNGWFDPRALNDNVVSDERVTTPSFFSANAKGKPLIFVGGATSSVGFVDIYSQAKGHALVGLITDQNIPVALATDTSGNLYVANGFGNDALVYAPPYTGAPKLILKSTNLETSGVAVSPAGIVGVVNQCSSPSCNKGAGSVTFYPENSAMACATVSNVFSGYPNVDAFDDKGNLYIAGIDSANNTVVGEIKGGCNAKQTKLLTTTNTLGYASAIQVDKTDRIAILNGSVGTSSIDTYNPPKKGSLGTPVSIMPLATYAVSSFAFQSSGKDVWTGRLGSAANCAKYDYPAGGAPEDTFTCGGPYEAYSIAVTPPLVP